MVQLEQFSISFTLKDTAHLCCPLESLFNLMKNIIQDQVFVPMFQIVSLVTQL